MAHADPQQDLMRRPGIGRVNVPGAGNLPYLATGASGVVSVVANVVPAHITELIQAVRRRDPPRARAIARITARAPV